MKMVLFLIASSIDLVFILYFIKYISIHLQLRIASDFTMVDEVKLLNIYSLTFQFMAIIC